MFAARNCETRQLETGNLLLRFSRAQLIGALVILSLLWLVILFRMLFSRA